ncbi:TetR/AcrR family transcriptional regulator [Nocardia carnea]|uniref:TetR/AcrR family transcriptional regulator n=1 Tax=Nocardia carnea TaxID=37328 RepID=A0ABW7TW02_9NOCA|nr:TetR/AcrR family transcriptional regulator [Nocardia carnea]
MGLSGERSEKITAGSDAAEPPAARATPRRPKSKKAQAQQRQRRRTARLSYDDWVDGALNLLSREGIGAIKIQRLCQELGVTKGSFYWHFDDIEQLMTAMADRWSAIQSRTVRDMAAFAEIPVEERIEKMAAMLVDQRHWIVETSVREWSRSNPKVAAAVRNLDQRVFETVKRTMLDLGFDENQAGIRAGAMVYIGLGLIHGRDNLPTPSTAQVSSVIELLARP